MSVAISPSVCVYTAYQWPNTFMALYCTIQNKHLLISIDLTINSYREFEFTVKTMNALFYQSGLPTTASSIYLL